MPRRNRWTRNFIAERAAATGHRIIRSGWRVLRPKSTNRENPRSLVLGKQTVDQRNRGVHRDRLDELITMHPSVVRFGQGGEEGGGDLIFGSPRYLSSS